MLPYEKVNEIVTKRIQEYFLDRGKPEVLNRIGKNLIVFNFIQPEAAKQILEAQLTKICTTIYQTKNIRIEFADENVKAKLYDKVLINLEEGGRGVGNVVEEYFTTPLSTFVFDNKVKQNQIIVIEDITGLDKIRNDSEIVIPKIIARCM